MFLDTAEERSVTSLSIRNAAVFRSHVIDIGRVCKDTGEEERS